MSDALEDHKGGVSIERRIFINFRFADGIVVDAEEEEDPDDIVISMNTACTRYRMEMGPDKTKIMTNNPDGFQREINIKGQRLEEVKGFKYLGSVILMKDQNLRYFTGLPRQQLNSISRDKNISLVSKDKLIRTLVLSTFIYACEIWTLTAELERRIHALEMRRYRRLLDIALYKDHVTNEEVRNEILNAIGKHDNPFHSDKAQTKMLGSYLKRSINHGQDNSAGDS